MKQSPRDLAERMECKPKYVQTPRHQPLWKYVLVSVCYGGALVLVLMLVVQWLLNTFGNKAP